MHFSLNHIDLPSLTPFTLCFLDSNSICDEGQCRCKSNYEPFQGLCIPTQGCLRDGHCINERNVCKNEKCACGDGYSWNTTVESCVLAPKTSSDKPKTVSKNVKRTSTVASTTENVAKEAVEGKDGAISPGGNILGVKCDSGGNGCDDEEDLSSYIVW